ncbi:MAG: hypothetical protein ACE15E_10225 [Acidobacteriota bacterium]
MISVWEDPFGAPQSTTYLYDSRDNLTGVVQGVQQRSFLYDSLGRLVQPENPEQDGAVYYSYCIPSSSGAVWNGTTATDDIGPSLARISSWRWLSLS